MQIHRFKRCPLSKLNFDQNFMKLCHIVTLSMMSSSSLIMVYMAPFFKELLPLVYEKSLVERRLLSNMNSFDYNSLKLGHIIKYHNVFNFQNGPYRIMPSGVITYCPLLMTIPYLYQFGNSMGIRVPWTHF